MINVIKDVVICFLATYLFAIIMNAPKKSVPISALIAAIGYIIYLVIAKKNDLLGYFIATFLISLSGEIAARIKKMPSTIFIFPGIIPLVPGMGLYNMMKAFVEAKTTVALTIGLNTISIAGVMAIALAFANILFRIKFRKKSTV